MPGTARALLEYVLRFAHEHGLRLRHQHNYLNSRPVSNLRLGWPNRLIAVYLITQG